MCIACGLPAPDSSTTCAYCGQIYNKPCNFEMIPGPTSFIWRTPTVDLAEARIEDGIWKLYPYKLDKAQISMLAIRRETKYTVALLDQDLNRIATVVVRCVDQSCDSSKRYLGVVNDDTRTKIAIHGDGPTGYHLVDRTGEVLALASPRNGFALAGIDVLLTNAPYTWRPLELFGTLLALILANLSGPECDFTSIDHLCLDSSDNYENLGPSD